MLASKLTAAGRGGTGVVVVKTTEEPLAAV